MSVVAAACAALAMLLAWPDPRWVVVHRLGGGAASETARWAPVVVAGGCVGLGATRLSSPHPAALLVAATAVGVAAFGWRQWRASRRHRERAGMREQVAECVDLLAAELRAGVLPHRALAALSDDFVFLATAARTAQLGGDVSAALADAAGRPGAAALRDLAGAWHVADRTGAPLAVVLERLAGTVRVDQEVAREVQSGVAPARATARLMAVLPAMGLVMGAGMGADPVGTLTRTLLGSCCLALGVALACAGVAWVERLAVRAEDT